MARATCPADGVITGPGTDDRSAPAIGSTGLVTGRPNICPLPTETGLLACRGVRTRLSPSFLRPTRDDPADLGGARSRRRRRSLRPGAHRRRGARPRGPDLRDRARRGPVGHRRARRHARRLGGPEPHGRRSAWSTSSPSPSRTPCDRARKVASLLAPGHPEVASVEDPDLAAMLPESKKRAYNVHPLVEACSTRAPCQELHAKWAPNIVTALGRFGGRTVGVIANNPLRLGGCLDSLSAEKASRFVRMCDAFGVPLHRARRRARLPPRCRPGVGRRRATRARSCCTRSARPSYRG